MENQMTEKPAVPAGLNTLRLLYFLYFAGNGIYVVNLSLHYQSIGLSGTEIGLIGSLTMAVAMFAGAFWGMLNDRIGRTRLLLLIAAAGGAITMWGISAMPTFALILPMAALFALFASPVQPLLDSINFKLLEKARAAYGRQRMWGTLGFVVTSFSFGFVLQSLGLQWIFIGFTIMMILFSLALLRLPAEKVKLNASIGSGLKIMLRQPSWLLFAVTVVLLWGASNSLDNYLSITLKGMGANEGLIGMAWAFAALAEAPVMYFSAPLLRKFGATRIMIAGLSFYILRMLLYSVMPAAEWALAIAVMHGLTFALFWISSVTIANELAPAHLKATCQGLLLALLNLASMIGVPLSGMMYDNLGPSNMFRVLAGVCAVALVVFLIGSRRLGMREQFAAEKM